MTMCFQTTGQNQQNGTICSIKTTFIFLTWIWRWMSGQRGLTMLRCADGHWQGGYWVRARESNFTDTVTTCYAYIVCPPAGLLDMLRAATSSLLSNLPCWEWLCYESFHFSITPKEKNNIIISVCWSLTHIYTHTQKMTVGQFLQTIFCLWANSKSHLFLYLPVPFFPLF